ncbi:MAG: hypothetical protein PVSMB7_27680 [Chloroflexota bacterium]
MQASDLSHLDMLDVWYESDPAMRVHVNFPFFAGTGTKHSSVVYFEIDPGCYLGTHTDSAEEILLILSGTVEARVGNETGRLYTGQAAVVPEMVSHGVTNVGEERARCVGFFAAATVVSTFDRPLLPFGQREVGTPPLEAVV